MPVPQCPPDLDRKGRLSGGSRARRISSRGDGPVLDSRRRIRLSIPPTAAAAAESGTRVTTLSG